MTNSKGTANQKVVEDLDDTRSAVGYRFRCSCRTGNEAARTVLVTPTLTLYSKHLSPLRATSTYPCLFMLLETLWHNELSGNGQCTKASYVAAAANITNMIRMKLCTALSIVHE